MKKNTTEEIKPGDQVAAPELIADAGEAVKPAAVQNGRIHATYLGLGLEREKESKLAELEFSFRLEESCNSLIPDKVRAAWRFLVLNEDKLIEVRKIEPVTISVFETPDKTTGVLHIHAASFSKAVVAINEEVGKGKTIEVVRFKFRLLVPRTPEVIEFAAWRDTEDFWITIPKTQREMAAGA